VPGVDQVPVRGGLAAGGVEAGAVQQRREQGVLAGGGRLVEPGERGGGARQRGQQRRMRRVGDHTPPVRSQGRSGHGRAARRGASR
jgi:hypothetical protein